MLIEVRPGLKFWYSLAIISSLSWFFSFLAMDFIKKTTSLGFISAILALALLCFGSNFLLSKFYFLMKQNPGPDRLFRKYKRSGKKFGFALFFIGNVGLHFFPEKSVACMLAFLFLAFYSLCALFCMQPYTSFGAIEFLLGACVNEALSLFRLRSPYLWLVIVVCGIIGEIRYCLEPVDPSGSEPLLSVTVRAQSNNNQVSGNRERKRGVPWTEEEHKQFLLGLQRLGKGDWRGISRDFVITRTPTQVASHAQKYFLERTNLNRRRHRSNLFDITTDSVMEGLATNGRNTQDI